ncbi:hypothetical protein A2U01_0027538, partial [Trifolium medium]|nr:hypothetical protein [Trifolium medium]
LARYGSCTRGSRLSLTLVTMNFISRFRSGRCIDALEEVIYHIETYDVTTINKSTVYAREVGR